MNLLKEWDSLPQFLKHEEVYSYYCILKRKEKSLRLKRLFDIIVSAVMLLFFAPLMFAFAVWIKIDSDGPVFFRQVRVTQYGRKFNIYKYRTMVVNAEQLGSKITVKNDIRVTRAGGVLRKFRIDEFPQLINILRGEMSFVGTRPEVPKYVKRYTPEMLATLLLPAGLTSEASIRYRKEEELLDNAIDADDAYVKKILPSKMKHNLKSIEEYSIIREFKTMIRTVFEVIK